MGFSYVGPATIIHVFTIFSKLKYINYASVRYSTVIYHILFIYLQRGSLYVPSSHYMATIRLLEKRFFSISLIL
jgi:hypothetical protein